MILTSIERATLLDLIEKTIESTDEDSKVLQSIHSKIKKSKEKGATKKHLKSLEKIAEKKIKNSKDKILKTLDLMVFYNTKITIYSVSKEAKVHYSTAKKFKDIIDNKEKQRKKMNESKK